MGECGARHGDGNAAIRKPSAPNLFKTKLRVTDSMIDTTKKQQKQQQQYRQFPLSPIPTILGAKANSCSCFQCTTNIQQCME